VSGVRHALVIFDCDGVLVDSERLVNRLESACFARLGLAISPDEARVLFKGQTVDGVLAVVTERLGRPAPTEWIYDWGMAVAAGFAKELREVGGVRAVLEACRRHGVPLCVASQSPPARVELALTLTGLGSYFENRIYTASMVTRPKPAPDLFLHAAAAMGADPRRTAVVEDSPTGVLAARAAGMTVYGYAGDEDAAALAGAGAITFTAMPELPALLGLDGHAPPC
jgi:HAD superfamily hydrolase (TIGR01509 family)